MTGYNSKSAPTCYTVYEVVAWVQPVLYPGLGGVVDRKNKDTFFTTNLLLSLKWGKLTIIRPNYNSLKSSF